MQVEYIIEDTAGSTLPAYVKTIVPYTDTPTKDNAVAWSNHGDRDTVMNALNNGGSRFVPSTRPPHS